MKLRIKSWEKFQHFKDRKPPWIKLYRDLLDDKQWHTLDAEAAKVLVMLWLLASENFGELPSVEDIAFRLRITEQKLNQSLNKLNHWLIFDDINAISEQYHDDTPETEEETYKPDRDITLSRTSALDDGFEEFWNIYPKKVGKDKAVVAWKKKKPPIQKVLQALEWQIQSEQWTKQNCSFIPNPTTYINEGRWKDEPSQEATF